MKEKLYLSGLQMNNAYLISSESLIALFVLCYCQPLAVEVVLVKEILSGSSDSYNRLFPVTAGETSLPLTLCTKEDCPKIVQACSLPAVFVPSDRWCIAGLSSSLRYVLKRAADMYKFQHVEALLGFRRSCLQACSEVSIWTKFCELDCLETLNLVWSRRNDLKPGDVADFPADILRFEHHLLHPPVLHNALKQKQQHIRRTVKDSAVQQELLKKKLKELPELEHLYAEGVSMTLADLMIFVCFHLAFKFLEGSASLSQICPLALKWYENLLQMNQIKAVISVLNQSLSSLAGTCPDLTWTLPDIPHESLYKSGPERYKPRWRAFTRQKDIEVALEIVKDKVDLGYESGAFQSIPWDSLPQILNPKEGDLPEGRLRRKCQQLESMLSALKDVAKDGDVIVDFCSGGGHLGIPVAFFHPSCRVILVENKEVSLQKAQRRVLTLNLQNVFFYQCNLDYFEGSFDVGICLHGCGTATDLVLEKCLRRKAAFVCSPCCYGGIKASSVITYPRSELFCGIPLSLENYITLGHGADQTHDENNPKTKQGRLCMQYVDRDRLALASQYGYDTALLVMNPATCTPKNHILVGVYKRKN